MYICSTPIPTVSIFSPLQKTGREIEKEEEREKEMEKEEERERERKKEKNGVEKVEQTKGLEVTLEFR